MVKFRGVLESYTQISDCTEGSAPLTPVLCKGQLYTENYWWDDEGNQHSPQSCSSIQNRRKLNECCWDVPHFHKVCLNAYPMHVLVHGWVQCTPHSGFQNSFWKDFRGRLLGFTCGQSKLINMSFPNACCNPIASGCWTDPSYGSAREFLSKCHFSKWYTMFKVILQKKIPSLWFYFHNTCYLVFR